MSNKSSGNNNKTPTHPYLREIVKSYKKGFKAVVVFSFFINLLMLSVPIYLLQIYNKIIPNHSSDTLYFITGIVIVALITLAIIQFLRNILLAKLGAWFNQQLGDHLLGSSIIAAAKSSGNASVNALKDLSKLRDFTTSSAVTSLLDLPWVPLYITILFFIHPVIGILVLIGSLLLFSIAIFNEISSRPMITETEKTSRNNVDLAASYVRNADVIQSMGMRKQLIQHWEDSQKESLETKYLIDKKKAKTTSLVKLIRLMLQILVIGTAALLILNGELSPGATIATILLLRNTISPLERSISAWKSVLKARIAYAKINQHLHHSPSLKPKREMPEPSGFLSVEKIRYRYPKAEKAIFYGLSFNVRPGESLALIGSTATGKTTLSKILVGIVRPSSGKVRWGGHDISLWDSEVLGSYMGYLPQSVELFSGTVRENIARMKKGDLGLVIQAAKSAGIHEVIKSLPQGYETQIGENGAYLSGGQRQRLALARAIYGNPKIIVLDEPDAHLDVEGKVALAKVIHKQKSMGAIIIIITHHRNIHKFVDKIYDIKKNGYLSDRTSSRDKVVNISSGRIK